MPLIRIEVGDRVQSVNAATLEGTPTVFQGVIQSIALGVLPVGAAPIVRVLVDTQDSVKIEGHLHEHHSTLWVKVFEDGSTAAEPILPEHQPGTCPCGEKHGTGLFSPEVLELHHRILQVEPSQRVSLLVEIGAMFLEGISNHDLTIPEWVLGLKDDLSRATDEVHRARSKLTLAKKHRQRLLHKIGRDLFRKLEEIRVLQSNIKTKVIVLKEPDPKNFN